MLRELSKQELDNFSSSVNRSQFLQSSFWADFQGSVQNKVWIYGIVNDDNLKDILGACLVIEKKLLFGFTYLYSPRGPILKDFLPDEEKIQITKLLFKSFRDICIKNSKVKNIFFRFEPMSSPSGIEQIIKVHDFQPSRTLFLDLSKSEEDLLGEMHEKTRYNIRLAQRKGVKIIKTNKEKEYVDKFLNLIDETAKRDGFVSHPKDYYKKMLSCSDANIDLWVAEKDGVVLCANLIINFGDTVTYLHGASSNEHRNLMAPHLLQWSQALWAKERGYKFYDFWGISKIDDKNNKWYGFTRFKKGYGGFEVNFPGTFDMVYNKSAYSVYNFLKRFM